MERKTLFLYNIEGTKEMLICRLCAQMGISVETVHRTDYLQPIGFLTGLPGFTRTAPDYHGPAFTDEMLLFNGFDDHTLSRFLTRCRETGIQKTDLKAGVTPYNVFWNSFQLHEELEKEHRMMTGK